MQKPIYLDYAATAPVDPRVLAKMVDCLSPTGNFGNPASRSHVYGWRAEQAVEEARREVADLIQADPREIVWTSGATEADNLALKGVAAHHLQQGCHIVTSGIEHKAVLDSCHYLQQQGCAVTYVQPSRDGTTAPAAIAAALTDDTVLVSLMHANNELGVVNDIAGVAELTRARDILLHVDAAQSAGKIAIDLSRIEVDLMSLSAHKMCGPKGVGVLYVRRAPALRLAAQLHGGGHERGLRSGTLPTHQIVGMGEAARLARLEMAAEAARIVALRERFWQQLQTLDGVTLNGDAAERLPGTLNIAVAGVVGETLLMALPELALSTGSACMSASMEPSHVLRQLGVDDALAASSLRVSFGRFSTAEEADCAAEQFCHAVAKLRAGTAARARGKA